MTNLYKHSKTDLLSETSFTNTDNYTSSILNSLLYNEHNEHNEQSGGLSFGFLNTNTRKQIIPPGDLNHKDIRLVREFMIKYSEQYINEMTRILKLLNQEMNTINTRINTYETYVTNAQKIKAPQKTPLTKESTPPIAPAHLKPIDSATSDI